MSTVTIGCQDTPANKANYTLGNYTYIFADPAPNDGVVSKIEVYLYDANPSDYKFAVFSRSGSNFTDKANKTDFVVSSGLNVFEEGVDFPMDHFPIQAGEYIGWYQPSGAGIERNDDAGYKGYMYDSGDQIGNGQASAFTTSTESSGREIQIRVTIRSPKNRRKIVVSIT